MSLLLYNSFDDVAVVLPPPPPLPILPPTLPPPAISGFAAMVAQMDRDARANLGGEPLIYAPAVGNAVPVTGIFDESFVLDKGGALAGVESVVPAVFLQLADLPVDPENDDPILTIRGRHYRVTERRPADFGSIVLALRQLST